MTLMMHHEQEHHSCYIGIDNGYSQLATGEAQKKSSYSDSQQ